MGERRVERSGSRRYKRGGRRQAVALCVAGLVLLFATAAALAASGDLTQPAGTAGCVSEDGSGPCANGYALMAPHSVAVSPDGKSVYVASSHSNAVVRLNRNPTTGAITEPNVIGAGCVSEDGTGGLCADGRALKGATSVAVSPDGKSVYVASYINPGAVARFNRNTTTGAITQPAGAAGCVSEDGSGPCADGHGLQSQSSVAVSPDGKSVYTASVYSQDVVRFNRNTTTGAITQPAGTAGCVSETGAGPCANGHGLISAISVAVSPDGKNVYATAAGNGASNSVVRLNRNTTTGAITEPAGTAGCVSDDGAGPCANGHGFNDPWGVTVSPDGKSVYVAANQGGAVARLDRNTTTGALTQPAGTAGCVSEDGSGPCADGHALFGSLSVAVSPDGKNVYAASWSMSAVTRLNRNTTTGAITEPAGTAACVSRTGDGPCAVGHALFHPYSVAVSPDGKSVYAASDGSYAVARFNRAP